MEQNAKTEIYLPIDLSANKIRDLSPNKIKIIVSDLYLKSY